MRIPSRQIRERRRVPPYKERVSSNQTLVSRDCDYTSSLSPAKSPNALYATRLTSSRVKSDMATQRFSFASTRGQYSSNCDLKRFSSTTFRASRAGSWFAMTSLRLYTAAKLQQNCNYTTFKGLRQESLFGLNRGKICASWAGLFSRKEKRRSETPKPKAGGMPNSIARM